MKKKHKIISLFSQDETGFKWSHLYILSEDEIKTGDFYIDTEIYNSGIEMCVSERDAMASLLCKEVAPMKIIATTDKSLGLPLIPQSFVKQYAKHPVKEVMVEMITDVITMLDPNSGWQYGFPKAYCGEPTHEEAVAFIKANGYPMDKLINYQVWKVEVQTVKSISNVEQFDAWTKDEVEWFILSEVINYIDSDKHSPTAVIKHLMSRLATLHHDYTQHLEDQKADQLLNEWKNEGISS